MESNEVRAKRAERLGLVVCSVLIAWLFNNKFVARFVPPRQNQLEVKQRYEHDEQSDRRDPEQQDANQDKEAAAVARDEKHNR